MAEKKKPLSDELKGFLSKQGNLKYYEDQFNDPTVNSAYWNAELEGLQKAYDAQQRREARSLGASLPPSIPITTPTIAPSAPTTTATSTWSFSWLKVFLSGLLNLLSSKPEASPSIQTPITASKDPKPPTSYASNLSNTTTKTSAPPKEFPAELKEKIKEHFGTGEKGLPFYEEQFKIATDAQWQKIRTGAENTIQQRENFGQSSDPKPPLSKSVPFRQEPSEPKSSFDRGGLTQMPSKDENEKSAPEPATREEIDSSPKLGS